MSIRAFAPLKPEHPLVGSSDRCPGCKQRFKAGDVVTLVSIGPGDDPEAREKVRNDQAYNAVAVAAHYACVTGFES